MNIEQLEFIVEVAKTGTLTSAAQNRHMTVAGISRAITILENELGVKIFKRSRTGAIPTVEGKLIITKAQNILKQIEELKSEAESYGQIYNAKLRISTFPGPVSVLIDTLMSMKREFPNIELEINEKETNDVLEDARNNRIDIGFVVFTDNLLHKNTGLLLERLNEGRMVIGVSKFSPLASAKKVTLADLAGQQLVLYQDSYIKQYIGELGDSVNVLFTSNNLDAILGAVKENIAITIGTDYSINSNAFYENGDIVMVNIELPHNKASYIWSVQSNDHQISTAAKIFLHRLKIKLKQ